jgi:pre-mRNA-splicing helicase BRR2
LRFCCSRRPAVRVAQIAAHLPQQIDQPNYDQAHTKTNIMLQCHFSRTPLPSDLLGDQKVVLGEAVRLLQAMVDVISSNGWLKPALACMELTQMISQGLWDRDSILLQIPHFTTVSLACRRRCLYLPCS